MLGLAQSIVLTFYRFQRLLITLVANVADMMTAHRQIERGRDPGAQLSGVFAIRHGLAPLRAPVHGGFGRQNCIARGHFDTLVS